MQTNYSCQKESTQQQGVGLNIINKAKRRNTSLRMKSKGEKRQENKRQVGFNPKLLAGVKARAQL